MFKLLSELNINNKNLKNLALLPGFNIEEPNIINDKFIILNNKLHGVDVLDEKILINLITQIDENKNIKKNLSRKKREINLKKLNSSRKKK